MGDHSSENYLDQLLNSMHGEETEHPKEQQAAKQVLRDDFEKQLFGEEETKEKAKAKNEEDFLREFEEELLKEDIPEYTESLNQKKQEEKADASKGFKPHLTENDKTALEIGSLTRQAWTIGVKTAKDGNNIESFQASISEFAHNHQDMSKEKLSEYVIMSAAVALNYPHDNNFKENIQNYTNQYQQKHGRLSIDTEKGRIMVLLEGASRIDTADRIDLVVNKKQNAPNVFQEETHNAMEAVLKNIGEGDKQKFVTELAEKTFYTKQQYFLAIEAHKLNLNVKTDKETKDKLIKK